jgi:hypothetical protein
MGRWRIPEGVVVLLGSICGVTTVVPDLGPIEQAYTAYLGMRVIARGEVAAADAESWGAPLTAGCRFITLVPEIGEATCLRFIEDAAAGACAPFVSHGWNATEITVRDTDALAARLEARRSASSARRPICRASSGSGRCRCWARRASACI